MQRTIRRPFKLEGIGLHTGCRVAVELKPAPAGTGVVFRRVDLQGFEIEASRRYVSRVVLATTLMKRGVMLSTVEHLLSAVYGLGLDNLYIDIDSLEVPILDGSSQPFVEGIREVGIEEQDAPRTFIRVAEPIRLTDGEKFVSIEPSPVFRVTYEIDFTHPVIGRQRLDLEVTPEVYAREISFSRTFGFYREVRQLLDNNLIRGGSFDNAVVLSDDGVMSGELRAPDEFVRHKVLDLIGDVSLCGSPVIGHVRAYKAGHALHTALATALFRNASRWRVAESELEAAVVSAAAG